MQNRTKDSILSLWSTCLDVIGWITVLVLIGEVVWIHVPDRVMVWEMVPCVFMLVGYNVLDFLLPHRCTTECDKICPGDSETQKEIPSDV
jgi:hypothetical protein